MRKAVRTAWQMWVIAAVAAGCGGGGEGLFGPAGLPDAGTAVGGSGGSSVTEAGLGGAAGGAQGGAGLGGEAGAGAGGTAGQGASGGSAGAGGAGGDPFDCANAAAGRSQYGCEFWPTVTANLVWSIFDFAVVVVNPGASPSNIQLSGPGNFSMTEALPAASSKVFYLPWVANLKGPDTDACGTATPLQATILQPAGAYRLTSTRAVAVYQFNPIEYKGVAGPPGKSWASCPGNQLCSSSLTAIGCFSFSSDASLLLPSSALANSYRVAGPAGWTSSGNGVMPSYLVITATQDNTQVGLTLKGRTLAGGGLPAMNAGQSASVAMNAGDVLELVGGNTEQDDLSGSLVIADHPVQVITGMPCRNVPSGSVACDHLEELLPPAQALGKHYVVTLPAGPSGTKVASHGVRLVGNVNGTSLKFDPPITAPGVSNGSATLHAGAVLDLGMQAADFQVTGDHEFIVATFMPGASIADPNTPAPDQKGDPSQSFVVAVEQLSERYDFGVPQDYELNFLNVVAPVGAAVSLDGQGIADGAFLPIGTTGWGVARLKLPFGGFHRMEATAPVGVQLYGYGSYTSYQMPGGTRAKLISPAPTP